MPELQSSSSDDDSTNSNVPASEENHLSEPALCATLCSGFSLETVLDLFKLPNKLSESVELVFPQNPIFKNHLL